MMPTASAIVVREISVEQIFADGKLLFQEHWNEVAQNRHARRLALDKLRYLALEASGSLIVLAAYDAEELVGYSVAFLGGPHLHDTETFCCVSDALFVTGSHRGDGIGVALMRRTEQKAKSSGASLMAWHAMKGSKFDARLSRSRVYQSQDVTYTRAL